MAPDTFPQFGQLPKELQIMIWKEAIPRRAIYYTVYQKIPPLPPPAITRTCQDSRRTYFENMDEAVRHLYIGNGSPAGGLGWVDVQRDVVLIILHPSEARAPSPWIDPSFSGPLTPYLETLTLCFACDYLETAWFRRWSLHLALQLPALRVLDLAYHFEPDSRFAPCRNPYTLRLHTTAALFGTNDAVRSVDLLSPGAVGKAVSILKSREEEEEEAKSCAENLGRAHRQLDDDWYRVAVDGAREDMEAWEREKGVVVNVPEMRVVYIILVEG